MFIDEADINVTAGMGGPGKVAFFANRGGPSGGNGGRGGNIYIEADNNVTSLNKFIEKKSYKAANGDAGGSNQREGKNGLDLIVHVPVGTTVTDQTTGWETEINIQNPSQLIARGGQGGRGNAAFKSSTNRTPQNSEPGEKGQTRHLRLILKLIADFGLIGLPNAGKSTLLNLLTAANVKTANYPFTTLEPNLGVFNGKIIADVPGLIEGAHKGRGLGIKFLKHIEKVQAIIQCISVESPDPEAEYRTVLNELSSYNPKLIEKKSILLLTKTDLTTPSELKEKLKIMKKLNPGVMTLSVYDDKSLEKFKKILAKL